MALRPRLRAPHFVGPPEIARAPENYDARFPEGARNTMHSTVRRTDHHHAR